MSPAVVLDRFIRRTAGSLGVVISRLTISFHTPLHHQLHVLVETYADVAGYVDAREHCAYSSDARARCPICIRVWLITLGDHFHLSPCHEERENTTLLAG